MQIVRHLLALALSVTGVAIPFGGPQAVVVRNRPVPKTTPSAYAATAKEHYLTTEQFGYIRPGFNIAINSVTVNASQQVVVDLSFTDDAGQPLDRAGKVTPGALSISFILSVYDPANVVYKAYTTRTVTTPSNSPHPGVTAVQPGTDQNGTWNDVALGRATYTFKTAFPTGYDATKTTTVGIYATRNLTAVDPNVFDKNYFANVEYDFRPDGQAVADSWGAMDLQKTCNTCHDPLAAHGGARQDVKLCVLCHTPDAVDPDTGNTVDFRVMIHKIHDGADLPSVQAGTPYQIVGFNQGVSDFSTVVFPQDIRNCAKCHNPEAPQGDIWYTKPNAAACGSCHDDVNFQTGENHPGGIQVDDSACASCHIPQGDVEYDASVMGAHTVPYKSTQLKGLTAEIVSVTNAVPGQKPTVVFKINNGDGSPVDPATLTVTGASLNVHFGGPTTDYALFPAIRERPASTAVFDGTQSTFTFTTPIPADATGTWTMAMDVRRPIKLKTATDETVSVNEAAMNPIFNVAITDSAPVPRKQLVDIDKCNVCHDRLALHGGQRLTTLECVVCHNPNANDGADVPESVDFKRMVHRIHRGENLTHDYTIGDTNFREVLFPGDLRNCEKCHVNDSQQLPVQVGSLPTPTPTDFYSPMQPTATACLGCHDTQEAAAHAYVMTAPFGESCAACHAPDDDFAVDKVHAR